MTQQELETIIQYQTKSLDMMRELLFKQVEADKKEQREFEKMVQVTAEELEDAEEELEFDNLADKKVEEDLTHEETL